jgi:hypothetical protein
VQDGFGLVVGRVAGRHPADAELTGNVSEPGVPDLTGVGLEVEALFPGLGADVAAVVGAMQVWQ